MSHELRTPLNAISGYAQLLHYVAAGTLSDKHKEYVQNIIRSSHSLLSLIDDILDFSRIEAGQVSLSIESLALSTLVAEAMSDMQVVADQRGVSMRSTFPFNVACNAMVDRGRFGQIVRNLLSNAIKYNRPSGTVEVRVEEKGPNLILSVIDTGFGIKAERLPDLFQPYNRLGAERGNIEGSGLGLVICKKMIEMMGGDIGCESVQGEGTTFWIRVPTAVAKVGAIQTHSSEQADDILAGRTVLYVDDNEINRHLFEEMFSTLTKAELITASSAGDALEVSASREVDLLVLDIHLPDMSGYDLLAAIRGSGGKNAGAPALALSAAAMKSDIKMGKQAGFVKYLTKPFEVNDMLRAVSGAVAHVPRKAAHAH